MHPQGRPRAACVHGARAGGGPWPQLAGCCLCAFRPPGQGGGAQTAANGPKELINMGRPSRRLLWGHIKQGHAHNLMHYCKVPMHAPFGALLHGVVLPSRCESAVHRTAAHAIGGTDPVKPRPKQRQRHRPSTLLRSSNARSAQPPDRGGCVNRWARVCVDGWVRVSSPPPLTLLRRASPPRRPSSAPAAAASSLVPSCCRPAHARG